MEQLIRVTTTEQGLQLVSARDLHSFLEISNHFTQWFDDNRQLFVEGIDYEAFKVKLKAGPGFTTKIDYALTLDTAKEMAMMSRVEKGKQARQYFLACERALRQKSLPDFSNPAAAARAWAEQYEKKQLAETTIKELQPKADFADAIMQSEDTVSVGDMARILAYKGLGQNKMFDFLRANAILISNGSNQPYQKYIDQGWCKVVETKWRHPKEGQKIGVKTVFTQKGILKVRELIERAGYVPIAKVNASQPFSANYYSSSV